MGDLPVELRISNQRREPQNRFTFGDFFGLGTTFPTGNYQQSSDNPLNGFGSGAYTLKEELLFQSLFDTWRGQSPMRVRVGMVMSMNTLGKRARPGDVSVYGTEPRFRGQASPGAHGGLEGIGVEYGLRPSVGRWLWIWCKTMPVAFA